MKRIAVLCAVVGMFNGCALSCSGGGESVAPGLEAVHDNARGVTCWRSIYARGNEVAVGIACLPDSALKAPAKATP